MVVGTVGDDPSPHIYLCRDDLGYGGMAIVGQLRTFHNLTVSHSCDGLCPVDIQGDILQDNRLLVYEGSDPGT